MRDFLIDGIEGSGGGGGGKGGGGGGYEQQNTLRSKAKARIVEVISEGEIEGPAEPGSQWIYFDTTPVENPNGSTNFKGVTWQFRPGLPSQEHVNGFTMTESPVTVESRVKFNEVPPVRRISDKNADAVRVVVRIPALATQDKQSGDLRGASVSYVIELRVPGGPWETKVAVDIQNQKCTSPYQKASRIELPPSADGEWDIRVRRTSADSEVVETQNETWWESYIVLTEGKFTYPNTALVAMEIDAEQFGSSIPARSYHVKGLRIQVPDNYDPTNRTYSGVWSGSFKKAWTNNPAWVLYDLLTNDRYGLGEFIDPLKIDKWSLYQIAQYCDQAVPSGFHNPDGSDIMEPRFTFNGVINGRDEAFRVLQTVTTAFRGMAYWSLGQVYASADMPQDPVKLITPSNVIGGHFKYSGTSLKARHSAALVSWNDPQDHFRPAIELVQNDEMIRKFGWRQLEMQAVGCTSRGQAHRYGKWALDTEQHETELAQWEASWDQADLKPGQIVLIADPRKAQVRTGGRIAAASVNVVDLDKGFVPKPGETYSLYCVLPDGTIGSSKVIAFENPDAEGGYTRVRIGVAYAAAPLQGAQWVISGTDVAPRRYRIMSVEETEDHIFRITALFNDPTKYARVEYGIKLDPIPYTRPRDQIHPPTNLKATESLYWINGQAKSRISLSWTPSDDFMAAGYMISAESPRDGFVSYGQKATTAYDIEDSVAGEWTFYVSAVSLTGKTSQPAVLKFKALGWEGIDGPFVSHLELYGRGSSTEFGGRDARFVWRNNFPGTAYETGSTAAGAGLKNPFFRDNVIRVFDAETGQLVRVESVLLQDYTYTYDKNVHDFAALGKGPQRKFRFEVTVRDNLGRESAPKKLVVENPVPDLIIPRLWTNNSGALYVDYTFPDDLDFAGGMVWASKSSGFDPFLTTPVYDGPNNFVSIPLEEFQTYYVRFAAYDVFGKTGLNVSPEIELTTSGIVVDATPPAIPTGLTLKTGIERMLDGTMTAKLTATWDKSPSDNFSLFEVEIKREGGDWIAFPTSGPRSEAGLTVHYEWSGLVMGATYTVRVKAISKNAVASGYSEEKTVTMPANTVAPGKPSLLTAQASLRSVYLKWANPPDSDLDVVEIWSNTVNTRPNPDNPADADKLIGTSKGIAFTHAGVETGVQRFYWVRAKNTSGLYSPFNATAGVAVTPGQVAEGDIAANAITADKIRAGEITGDHINVETSLPPTITIGKTGVSIGAVSNPAALINQQTTKIDPGQILISGATTLASWRDGTDVTKIAGGSIAANSIQANSLAVGLRGLTFSGLQFSYNKDTSVVSWTSGQVEYVGDDGTMKTEAISASSKQWSAGNTLYFVWQRGATALLAVTAPPVGADKVILATYRGGTDLNVTYGRTMIDGSQIRTRSLTADLVSAGEFITDKAQIKGGVIENTHLAGYITFDKLAGGTLSAADKIRVGGDRFILNAPDQTLRIYDAQPIGQFPGELSAGRLRVKIGKLGEANTDYGLAIYDAAGKLILGSGGFGTSAIPDSAIAALSTSKLDGKIPFATITGAGILAGQNFVDRSQTTGFGAMSAIDFISANNVGSYISAAAISDAYIANLHGNKIFANTINAASIVASSITSRELSTGLLIAYSAQIANAVIQNAHISNLSVDHLKIANGAVTGGASVSGYPTVGGLNLSTSLYCYQGAKILVIASYAGYSSSNASSPKNGSMSILIDGSVAETVELVPVVTYVLDRSGSEVGTVTVGYGHNPTTFMASSVAVWEGTHTFGVSVSGAQDGKKINLAVFMFSK